MNDITLVSVNYRSTDLINEIEDKLQSVPVNYTVVDNSGEFSPRCSSTKVINSGANVGFGRACNLGVAEATTRLIMLLNPDTYWEVADLERFISASARITERAIWGPFIRDGQNAVVTLRRPGRFGLAFRRDPLTEMELRQSEVDVSYVSGACLVTQRTLFTELGGFSNDIFLYGEDLDFCLRGGAAGARVMLLSAAEIKHKGGESSSRLDRLKRLSRSIKGHRVFFAAQGFSRFASLVNAIHLASGRRF